VKERRKSGWPIVRNDTPCRTFGKWR